MGISFLSRSKAIYFNYCVPKNMVEKTLPSSVLQKTRFTGFCYRREITLTTFRCIVPTLSYPNTGTEAHNLEHIGI